MEESQNWLIFCERSVRKWVNEIFDGYFSTVSNFEDVTDEELTEQLSSNRGKHPKVESVFRDEIFQAKVRAYVRENGYVKGKPNMTLQQFVVWVEQLEGIKISTSTASVWLHALGFTHKQFSKGVFFDGHERADVI